MTKIRLAVLVAGFWIGYGLAPIGALSATFHVPLPYPTIQAGIDAAAFGDTVLVAPGTYTDFETRVQVGGALWTSCAFLKDGVVVKSVGGPDVTIIDQGNLNGPQALGVIARYHASNSTALEGFTLQGPSLGSGIYGIGIYMWLNANVTIRNCKLRDFDAVLASGGGMIAVGNASVIDCEFTNCKAAVGGAIWATSGHIELIRCTFRQCNNWAVSIEEPGSLSVSALIEDCRFMDNVSAGGVGGLGIGIATGGATVRGCYFENNVNHGTGSGALSLSLGPKTVENCVFVNNGALGGNGQGGAISSVASPCTVRDCTFVGNYKTPNAADGACVQVRAPTMFTNNIVVGSHGGAAIDDYHSPLNSSCNVFWNNAQGSGIPLSPTDRVIDPEFCDPDAGDFTLRQGSPCLPEDPLGCGLIGAFEQGCGTISIESKSWGTIKGLYR